MNSTLIVPLTICEAKAAKITSPVTRSYPDTEANRKAIFEPVLADFERDGIPSSIVIERYQHGIPIAAVWRGKPPKPKRTSHQFRAELYRGQPLKPIRNAQTPT